MLDSIKFTHSTSSEHMSRTSESDDLKTSKRERLKEKAHDVGHSAKETFKSGEFLPMISEPKSRTITDIR